MTNSTKNPSFSNTTSYGVTPLSDWGLIFVEGPDAATLLQSQLSNSVLGLKPSFAGEIARDYNAVRLVGYCNPKGRLLASAWLGLFPQSEESDDRFALFISKDIAASIAKKLSMYVLRSKVKVVNAGNDFEVFGVYATSITEIASAIQTTDLVMQLPPVLHADQSYERALIARTKLGNDKTIEESSSLLFWNSLEVLSAIPRINLATQEQFVPQMINFESVAGIDFKKGCYPGQEVVARSQYRGVVKRRLQLANTENTILASNLAKPGAELYHSNDANQPCGMVVLAAQDAFVPDQIILQAECKLDALLGGEIHLGSIGGPMLKIDPLPYPLIEI